MIDIELVSKLEEIPRERLVSIHDELSNWIWPEELGEAPEGWEIMGIDEKYIHIKDLTDFIESDLSKKEILRYHHTHNLNRTEQQFEDWWDSEIRKTLMEMEIDPLRKDNHDYVSGIAAGVSIVAVVINLILLIVRLC